jgi:hypothetical protein
LTAPNFSKEARLEKKWFSAVPAELNGFDVMQGRVRENVDEHAPDLLQSHAVLFVEVLKLVTVAASQVAELRKLHHKLEMLSLPHRGSGAPQVNIGGLDRSDGRTHCCLSVF